MKGLRYRPLEYDDWGIIRHGDSDHIFAVVRRPLDESEAAMHRANKTDPFEDLAKRLIASFAPPKPEGIVEALREAVNKTLSWAEQRCPCNNDEPRICPLCQADVAKDGCLSAENTIPRQLLHDLRAARSLASRRAE
ncbi:hypothetical protein [Mesorhizobium sp.]|uniref:hypothetical protein n=1 Tax=Mesorhizobium sp. TaxID=1871066 RepID=UPI000FE6BE15|nr:hypothetical protein [Mesorhizobium sp.]RWO22860.1 MAG: hypothetical protein EOS09_19525 [Mesorhizobium sp.]